jgi:hypothetical protein
MTGDRQTNKMPALDRSISVTLQVDEGAQLVMLLEFLSAAISTGRPVTVTVTHGRASEDANKEYT